MTAPNIYPEQLRQITAYVQALDDAEAKIGDLTNVDFTVNLVITVTDAEGHCVFGKIVDEVGGAWSFQPAS